MQLNNPSLKEFLGQFGWRTELLAPGRQSACTYSGKAYPEPTAEQEEMAELLLPARLVAVILSDSSGQLAKDVAASVCSAVVQIRAVASPLRTAVGWTVKTGGVLPVTTCFVDAQLTALLTILCGSLLLKRLVSALILALTAAAPSEGTTVVQGTQGKAKEE